VWEIKISKDFRKPRNPCYYCAYYANISATTPEPTEILLSFRINPYSFKIHIFICFYKFINLYYSILFQTNVGKMWEIYFIFLYCLSTLYY